MTKTYNDSNKAYEQLYHYSFTRQNYIDAFTQWYDDYLKHEMSLFAITATASAGYSKKSSTKARAAYYGGRYQAEVIKKVRRQLSRNTDHLKLYDHYYEHEDQTKMKGADWAKPHHLHGILVFPKALTHKIWVANKAEITRRLDADFKTQKTFKNILIEPITDITGWLYYITKRKDFNENML